MSGFRSLRMEVPWKLVIGSDPATLIWPFFLLSSLEASNAEGFLVDANFEADAKGLWIGLQKVTKKQNFLSKGGSSPSTICVSDTEIGAHWILMRCL